MGGSPRPPGRGPLRIGTVSTGGEYFYALYADRPLLHACTPLVYSRTPPSRAGLPRSLIRAAAGARRSSMRHAPLSAKDAIVGCGCPVSPGPSARRSLSPDRPGGPGRSRRAKVPSGVEGLRSPGESKDFPRSPGRPVKDNGQVCEWGGSATAAPTERIGSSQCGGQVVNLSYSRAGHGFPFHVRRTP